MKNKEETVLITAVDNGSTVELEINTTLPHEETKEMLAGAVCAVYGISDFHEGDVASFLEALGDEYRKEERSPHSSLVNCSGRRCTEESLPHGSRRKESAVRRRKN